jgi:hypothetical protein
MRPRAPVAVGLLLLVLAPLAGGLLRGLDPAFTEFPPVTQYVRHAPFSLPVFAVFALLAAGAAVLLVRPSWFGFRRTSTLDVRCSMLDVLPPWFYLGLSLNLLSWVLAWARFPALGALNDHLFFPLWLGYILVMDGLVVRRTGTSLLKKSPRTFAALFPASAVVWWYFEYLNRFVQNWWYEDIARFSALHYAGFATLCFSTVLPAVFETADWLSSFKWFQSSYREGPRWRPLPQRALPAVLGAGVAGLVLMAVAPSPAFFLTWAAPLAVIAGSLALAGVETPFSDLPRGDHTRLFALAAAALVCGFFWEMWNFWSLPKWHYAVPYVSAPRIFEMPVVGYAGYLPFGPICGCLWLAVNCLFGRAPATPRS